MSYYSVQQQDVHHIFDECTEGNNIEDRYRAPGTGGLPLCATCEDIRDRRRRALRVMARRIRGGSR